MRGILVLLLVALAGRALAQDTSEVTDGFYRIEGPSARKTIAAATMGLVLLTITYDDYNVWWKQQPKGFSFFSNNWVLDDQLGLDKAGHFFGTYAFFKTFRALMLWAGYSRSTAMWWGVGVGLWNGLRIEIGDGFSPFGFDYQDLAFDFGGVAYGLLQTEISFLQNFNWKFSYWSSKGIASPANFVQHYEAMTIWLTMNVHNLLPEAVDRYWPECIQLAAGLGVNDSNTRRKFAIGLDFNLSAFDTGNDDIHLAQRLVEIIHFPAPAVKMIVREKPVYQMFYLK